MSSLLKDKIEIGVEEAELKAVKTVSAFPPKLKWLFIVLVAAIIPGYFVAKQFSYKYWQKKYNAYILSAKPSFSEPKPPRLASIDITTDGLDNYSAVAIIVNDNLELSLDNVPYQLKFFNGKGEQVYQAAGKMFLLPGQLLPSGKKYLVAPKFTTKEKVVSARLELPDNKDLPWQKRLKIPNVKLTTPTPDAYYQTDPLAFVLEGAVTNGSAYALKEVKLTFLVYNFDKQIIAVSQRVENSLSPFERRSYKQLWPNVRSDQIFRSEVIAETNALSDANLRQTDLPANSASKLDRPQSDLQNQ